MSSCGSNADMETSAPVPQTVPLTITLCSTPNHASIRYCLKSSISCAFSGRLAAPYFVINVLRSGLFSGQKSGNSYKSVTLFAIGLGAANDAQNVRVDTARGQFFYLGFDISGV